MALIRAVLLLALGAAAAVACAGGDDDNVGEGEGTPTVTRSTPARPFATVQAESPTSAASAPAGSPTRVVTPTVETVATATATRRADPGTPEATATVESPAGTETQEPAPTSTSAPAVGELELVQQGFSEVQEYDEVAYGFVVENPSAAHAVINTRYTVTAFQSGNAVEMTEGYLDYVAPDERIGVGGSIFIPEGSDADRINIEILGGEAVEPWIEPGFSVSQVRYQTASLFPSATAVISTTFDEPLRDVEVFAVGYDAAGNIVGGGYSFLSFILAGGSVGVEAPLSSAEEPARVEIYPVITSLTLYGLEESSTDDAEPLLIVAEGFGPSNFEGEIGWGFIVENPNPGLAADTAAYQVTAYAEDGSVLGAYASYISLLLPGERLGIGGSFYLPAGTVAARLEFQTLGRYFVETALEPGFLESTGAAFETDGFSPRVTGTVVNGLDRDLADVEVYAIAYNVDGHIIGGGFTFVDLVPAGEAAAVDVAIAVSGEPASVELFATVSGLTDIE